MSLIHAIAYVSTVSDTFDIQEVEELLVRARANNRSNDITGALLYCNGSFMQYMEGPKSAVLALYSKVSRDPRHHGLIEMLNATVDSREFSQWSMGYAQAAAKNFAAVSQAPAYGAGTTAVRHVLDTFWAGNTTARAAR